ncbi:putative ralfl33 precursor protein [Fusarium austroafricanum]|uniref:Putative ralfl33 protein n=1 Tax=Fusarium austroafricanum TaxID=2364996 RepID=A0A8H4K8J6_9HYPO|nr:putative ralfl33 precursor protein [Fusarium austroafricanum]
MKTATAILFFVSLVAAAPAPAPEPQGGVIGYGALNRDRVPCSVNGPSAANCRPGAVANPGAGRGCNAINQCRGGK